jgi:Plasmid replication region DNA-binding N-term
VAEALKPYGSPARGVTQADVSRAADALLHAGERPTVEKIRAAIGSGSPNTVGPLLDSWWKRLAGRLDAGPEAFHRLPESVAHVAEALWMQALDEGRRRALLEQGMSDRTLAQDKERVELRSHVLTLREGEMEARLKDRDRTIADLTGRVDMLTGMLQQEQASRDAVARRLSAVETELSSARQVNLSAPMRTSGTRGHKTVVNVPHRIKPPTKRKPATISRKRKQKSRRRGTQPVGDRR